MRLNFSSKGILKEKGKNMDYIWYKNILSKQTFLNGEMLNGTISNEHYKQYSTVVKTVVRVAKKCLEKSSSGNLIIKVKPLVKEITKNYSRQNSFLKLNK